MVSRSLGREGVVRCSSSSQLAGVATANYMCTKVRAVVVKLEYPVFLERVANVLNVCDARCRCGPCAPCAPVCTVNGKALPPCTLERAPYTVEFSRFWIVCVLAPLGGRWDS